MLAKEYLCAPTAFKLDFYRISAFWNNDTVLSFNIDHECQLKLILCCMELTNACSTLIMILECQLKLVCRMEQTKQLFRSCSLLFDDVETFHVAWNSIEHLILSEGQS